MPPDEILYSPALLAVLGLCIGSFVSMYLPIFKLGQVV